jgi:hypothetical protein
MRVSVSRGAWGSLRGNSTTHAVRVLRSFPNVLPPPGHCQWAEERPNGYPHSLLGLHQQDDARHQTVTTL